jgi:hypothetical protein
MPVRFHTVNKASRQKSKPFAEELWEQYEPYIEEECRKGRKIADLARLIEGQSIPGFAPTYVPQFGHRGPG